MKNKKDLVITEIICIFAQNNHVRAKRKIRI